MAGVASEDRRARLRFFVGAAGAAEAVPAAGFASGGSITFVVGSLIVRSTDRAFSDSCHGRHRVVTEHIGESAERVM